MDYYFLQQSTDLSVIGKYPQLEKMFDGFNMKRNYEAWGLYSDVRRTPMEKVSGFQLKYHAKVTDWVSAAQFGTDSALFSKRWYDLLHQFACMKEIAVEAEIDHHKKSYPYRFIHFPEFHNHFVDFTRSRLYWAGRAGWMGDVQFENFGQYQKTAQEQQERNLAHRIRQEYEQVRDIRVVELFLDGSKIDLDFFRLVGLINRFVVSERLKNAIVNAAMTGMLFEPAQGHREQVWDTSVTPWRAV